MQAQRESAAEQVSFNSTTETLDRNFEITPPTSPRPPLPITENYKYVRESSNPSPAPPPRSPSRDPLKNSSEYPPSTRLFRSTSVVYIVAIYSIIAIVGWVVTALLTFRPVDAKKYGLDFAVITDNYGGQGSNSIKNEILNSEKWIPAVRALRAIAAVLTFPVASAVCASAAVVFVERNASKSRLNIRQVMLLADRVC
jgi:hypothetical protein